MATAFRADLQQFLADFIERHRGLRFGHTFGRPAGYAGRRVFVRLMEDGLLVKLPVEVARAEVRAGRASLPERRTPNPGSRIPNPVWIKYSPRNTRDTTRLAPILEVAARCVAEAA